MQNFYEAPIFARLGVLSERAGYVMHRHQQHDALHDATCNLGRT